MYTFVRCQTHSKCPDLQGWYLVLEPDDLDTLMKVHKGVASFYFSKFGADPHYQKSEIGVFYHPVRLAAAWLVGVEKFLAAGTTLAINPFGGMLPLESLRVLATVDEEQCIWPNHYPDEIITITRWPDGKHYYLSSNKQRVFVPPKHSTYAAAHHVAQKYTTDVREKNH